MTTPPRCSRAGCSAQATFAINWRNPKIHSADRVKVWLACDEHRGYLAEYLGARSFPVIVGAVDDVVEAIPDSARTAQYPRPHSRAGD
jgi:hypothetical protein